MEAEDILEIDADDITSSTHITDSSGVMRDEKGRIMKGSNLATFNKGKLHTVKQLREAIAVNDWKQLKLYMSTLGIQRYMMELDKLEGKDYITAFMAILPFVKGKIANVDAFAEDEEEGKKKQINHTITIKDMRNGTERILQESNI